VTDRGLEVYVSADRVIFAFPTGEGLFGVFVAWRHDSLARVKTDIERHVIAALDEVPHLAERVRGGRREERFRGATDLPNFLRTPYGPGWALVGDAACHKDPSLALGIGDAFRDADLLVGALDEGFCGRSDLQLSLEAYERGRNEATRADYYENLSSARFERPPERVFQTRAAVRGDPEATRRLFMVRERMIPYGDGVAGMGALPSSTNV
jgi:flavin-dependent dehydrogenase